MATGRSSGKLAAGWGSLSHGSWILLVAFTLVLYGFNLGGARALTEHEIYVGGVAKQMVAEGSWLLPRIGDHFWLEKPPLPYWLASVFATIFGKFSEVTVRLPSALAGLGVVVLVATLSARWFGPAVGLLAGLIQASTVYMVTYARLAEADMLLATLVVGCIAVFARMQSVGEAGEGYGRGHLWRLLFWSLLGLTGLSKGPLFGAMLALAPCLAWLVSRRDTKGLKKLWSLPGILIGLSLMVAWPVLVVSHVPEAWQLLTDHLLGRAIGRLDFNIKPPWYYLTTWPWQVLPWTPLVLIGAGPSLWRAWNLRDSPDRFLWCWALVPAALLSLSRGKHHHYLIHSLPALSPVMALGLLRLGDWFDRRAERPVRCGNLALWLMVPAAAASTALAVRALPDIRVDAYVFGGLAIAGLIACGLFLKRRLPGRAFGALLAVILVGAAYVHGWVLPRRDPSAADRDFLSRIGRHVPGGATLLAVGGPEIARHIFYITRPLEGFWRLEGLAARLQTSGTAYVVARARTEAELGVLGAVTRIAQSARTRNEHGPQDRYALFRVEPRAAVGHRLAK